MPSGMFDFAELLTAGGLAVLAQVILIDLTMAGDNVVIIGTLTSGLQPRDRRRVIMLGVAMAVVFLIGFALVATQLLRIKGLLLAGGLLLLVVAYNMFRALRRAKDGPVDDPATPAVEGPRASKTVLQAAIQITIANLAMSLDNVLAVAAAARGHPAALLVGLAASVTFMGAAASVVARLIHRFPVLAWAGLAMILYVAVKMIWEGWHDVAPLLA